MNTQLALGIMLYILTGLGFARIGLGMKQAESFKNNVFVWVLVTILWLPITITTAIWALFK